MPELPHVEVARRYVDATSLHRPIEHVRLRDPSLLGEASRQRLAANLVGDCFTATHRHGKLLGVSTEHDGCLVLHLGMSGELVAFADAAKEPEHSALLVAFDDGFHLAFENPRRLGRVDWTADFDSFVEAEDLGPDALGIERRRFRRILEGRRGAIKPLLMDQQVLAGIGNEYADEVLFQTGLWPRRTAGELTDSETEHLYRNLQRILETAIERRAAPDEMPRSWLLPRRQSGADCPRCEGEIRRDEIAGRATYWCPSCQGDADRSGG